MFAEPRVSPCPFHGCRKDHDALTNLDRVIFFTPEDALATETDDGRALVLAEDVALTMEPEDEEAAAAVKVWTAKKISIRLPVLSSLLSPLSFHSASPIAALQQPLKKGEKPNPQVEARLRQLAREAGSRKRTLKIKARLDLGMDTIAEMCRAAPSVVQSFLAELSDMGDHHALIVPYPSSPFTATRVHALPRSAWNGP